MARASDKRGRLVIAADKLFHEQGVTVTTLANIAELSQVPLGNVYYYFKTKEAIILAVIAPLVRQTAGHSTETARFGDALGGLCQELGKQGGQLAIAAASLLQEIMSWCEKQFTTLGKGDEAWQLAMILVSRLQGISLLTLTFKNPNYTNQQTNCLVNWLGIAS